MKAENNQLQSCGGKWIQSLIAAACLIGITSAMAQPTIVSTVPANNATGVSTTESVVFTFSTAMDTTATMAEFITESPFAILTTTPVWSVGNTVLTCTPSPAFPVSSSILWVVSGQDTMGNQLSDLPPPEGMFTTGASTNGGGGTNSAGFGTNKYTSFVVGKGVAYDQFTADAPTLETNSPFEFVADIVLASNRTATIATLALPSTTVSNFEQNPIEPDQFFLFGSFTNQSSLEAAFPAGNYGFTLSGGNTNLQVTVNYPASFTQPNAPHVNNFAATQAVDPTLPLKVSWDAFSGAGANDYVEIVVGDNFSAGAGTSNALSGTATFVVVPANTLAANNTYDATLAFLHIAAATNEAGVYTTVAYIESVTEFSVITTNGGGGVTPSPPSFASATVSGHTINFSVNATANQNVTIQFNTDGLIPSGWQTLITTNSSSGVIQFSDAINTANKSVFYRAMVGP